VGLVALLIVAAGTPGCGRVGLDQLAPDGVRPPDASVEKDGPDASLDASVDAEAAGAGDSSDSGPAGALDASPDSGPVEAMEASSDATCPVSTVVDYCASLPPLPAPPVIDGILDCGPALVPMPPLDWVGPSPLPAFPVGNSASLAAAWRPDGLYVFVAVTTPAAFPADAASPAFYGAGVEIYVDSDGVFTSAPNYDDPGAIQLVVTAPPDATTPSQRGEGYRNAADEGPWASTQFGAYPTATGFVFEGFVVAADLGLSTWALGSGDPVGFDVAVDVSYATEAMTGAQGHRVGEYFFHVGTVSTDGAATGPPYQDPRSFCTPTLAPM
jgi:hypothetical protein